MKRIQYLLLILSLFLILGACSQPHISESSPSDLPAADSTESTAATTPAPGRKLQLRVVETKEPSSTVISQKDLGKEHLHLSYGNLEDVQVIINDQPIPLEQAIAKGEISVPEIFSWAQLDAMNGFCVESFTSERGLAHFTYAYPEYMLRLAHDVYETPSGKQELIKELYIYDTSESSNRSIQSVYVDHDSKWGYFLDREDWGLTLTASNTSPTQVSIDYSKVPGQEIGTLSCDEYMLFYEAEDGKIVHQGNSKKSDPSLPITFQASCSGQLTFDWSDNFGPLSPGNYVIALIISDNYTESELHPLMVNFYDRQTYHIPFTVD